LAPKRGRKTLTNALVLTNEEADLLRRALEEVKTKTFEESNISLDDMGALKALVANFKEAEKLEPEKEARQKHVDSLGKRLFLGHIIGREGSPDTASGSRQS
jgi:signal transduction histidine kinase